MDKFKVAINGMGRIGRNILRQIIEDDRENALSVVAVNNPGNPNTYLHLLAFDSVHGRLPYPVEFQEDKSRFCVKDKIVKFYSHKNPQDIPWGEKEVDIVIDATGKFKKRQELSPHLRDSVKKVVLCTAGKEMDATVVMGVNHQSYDPARHHIVSNASCTTNCLAPMARVLEQKFGIDSGFMSTVHSYTNDQSLLDSSHRDLRRARTAGLSMIPTSTGATKLLGVVLPELQGRLDGFAVRVPTPNVSMVDLTVNLKKDKVTADEINHQFKIAAQGELKGILTTEERPLVSCDYRGMKESCAIDLNMTNVIGNTAKVVGWYDNEAGFSNRVIDLVNFIGTKL